MPLEEAISDELEMVGTEAERENVRDSAGMLALRRAVELDTTELETVEREVGSLDVDSPTELDRSGIELDRSGTELDRSGTELDRSGTELDRSGTVVRLEIRGEVRSVSRTGRDVMGVRDSVDRARVELPDALEVDRRLVFGSVVDEVGLTLQGDVTAEPVPLRELRPIVFREDELNCDDPRERIWEEERVEPELRDGIVRDVIVRDVIVRDGSRTELEDELLEIELDGRVRRPIEGEMDRVGDVLDEIDLEEVVDLVGCNREDSIPRLGRLVKPRLEREPGSDRVESVRVDSDRVVGGRVESDRVVSGRVERDRVEGMLDLDMLPDVIREPMVVRGVKDREEIDLLEILGLEEMPELVREPEEKERDGDDRTDLDDEEIEREGEDLEIEDDLGADRTDEDRTDEDRTDEDRDEEDRPETDPRDRDWARSESWATQREIRTSKVPSRINWSVFMNPPEISFLISSQQKSTTDHDQVVAWSRPRSVTIIYVQFDVTYS